MQYIDDLIQSPKIVAFKIFDFKDFLIKPIQRLPQYKLILKDLLKNTEKSHPDYKNLQYVYEEFNKINLKNGTFLYLASNFDRSIVTTR